MNLRRIFTNWVGALFQKDRLDARMAEELRSHVEMQTEANVETGMSPEAARYEALRQFGSVESIKVICREQRGVGWIHNLGQDIRYGTRSLCKNPGFTFITVFTLALGIGANSAIFTVINGVLLRPLPFPHPDQLVAVWEEFPKRGTTLETFSYPNFIDLRSETEVFANAGAYSLSSHTLTGVETPERLNSLRMTASLLPTLGINVSTGRNFTTEEDRPDAERAVLLSDHLWRGRFGSNPLIVGQKIELNDEPVTIVGVLPKAFRIGGENPDICLPLRLDPLKIGRGMRGLQVIARLNTGSKMRGVEPQLGKIADRLKKADEWANADLKIGIVPLHEQIVGNVRLSLLMLGGAVGCVLLIACANVANLSLARGFGRQSEMAIRSAIGASRARIVRQLLTESLVISILGGGLGLVIGRCGVMGASKLLETRFPQLTDLSLNPAVLSFTFAVSILSGLAFGLLPAFMASQVNLIEGLKVGAKSATTSTGRRRLREGLVVVEVALAFVLLTGSGLLLRSLSRLRDTNPGFDPRHILTVQTTLSGRRYNDNNAARLAAVRDLATRVEKYPGVEAVTFANSIPFVTDMDLSGTAIEGRTFAPNEYPFAHIRGIGGEFFKMLGVPLLSGRYLTQMDNETAQKAVVINATMARRYWGDQSPIGSQIRPDALQEKVWLPIVGVVADMKNESLAQPARPEIYYSYAQYPTRGLGLIIRSGVPPTELADSIRREITKVDSSLAITTAVTMEKAISETMIETGFHSAQLGILAALALVLAAIGIYGVLSYTVSQQSQDMGIRLALGATKQSIHAYIILGGMKSVVMGIGLGLVIALLSMHLISRMLFEIQTTDPKTLVAVALILTATALAACYFPARRAAGADPMASLRSEL